MQPQILGLVLTNSPGPSLHELLDVHVNENLGKYLLGMFVGSLITYAPEYITGYGMKARKIAGSRR
jgi:hypothetical protein